MKTLDTIIVLVAVLLLAGCSSVIITSDHIPPDTTMHSTSGAYYFLPKATLRVRLEQAGQDCQLTFDEQKGVQIVPDEDHLYIFDYNRSSLSNDTLTVQIGTNGLLQKIESSAEDKTGDIILKLVELGKEAFKAAAVVGGVGKTGADFVFSPEDFETVNTKILAINSNCPQIKIDPPVVKSTSEGRIAASQKAVCAQEGVCFRPLLAHTLSFVLKDDTPIESHSILIPNEAPILSLPIKRAAFVKVITNVTFDNGILKEVHIEKPSEVAAALQIPVEIAKTIASIPGEILQLKVDYTNKQRDLATAQKNSIDAAKALKEAEKTTKGPAPNP